MIERWQEALRPNGRIGRTIEAHVSVGSTNDRARELLAEGAADGAVVLSEEQTAGRGRRGRSWISPPGVNLHVTVALEPALPSSRAWQLGLGTALATVAACRELAPVTLKWPNDVVDADGRKVAGLLIETMASGDRLVGAVLGIGINVNWPRGEMPPDIAPTATSLMDLAGTRIDRVRLLAWLLAHIEREVVAIEAGDSPLARYRAACSTLGEDVVVLTADGSVTGTASGLDAHGSLIVDAPDGRHVLASGEVVQVRPRVPA